MQPLEMSEEKRRKLNEEYRQRREQFIEGNTPEWV